MRSAHFQGWSLSLRLEAQQKSLFCVTNVIKFKKEKKSVALVFCSTNHAWLKANFLVVLSQRESKISKLTFTAIRLLLLFHGWGNLHMKSSSTLSSLIWWVVFSSNESTKERSITSRTGVLLSGKYNFSCGCGLAFFSFSSCVDALEEEGKDFTNCWIYVVSTLIACCIILICCLPNF